MYNDYKFPVYGTQGGGIVREINNKYYFIIAPEHVSGLTIGDEMPQEWSIVPANDLARKEF